MKFFYTLLFLTIPLWSLSHYHVVDEAITYQNKPYRAIRSFEKEKILHHLIVNEMTLETHIIQQRIQKIDSNPATPYQKLLDKYTQPPYLLQNYGVVSIESDKIYITTDLCPSSQKGYEREFYQKLIKHYPNPVEITLFISGKWIDKHPQAFQELKKWEDQKRLSITWGNHTHTHPYHPKAPLANNFLLSKGVDIEKELLGVEKKLIEQGVTPSIFFRFPGLVQNEKAIKTLKRLGLIAVGSNAWLAKGEKIQKGSIILLHGNKNEPQGIEKANILFQSKLYTIGSLLDIVQ